MEDAELEIESNESIYGNHVIGLSVPAATSVRYLISVCRYNINIYSSLLLFSVCIHLNL